MSVPEGPHGLIPRYLRLLLFYLFFNNFLINSFIICLTKSVAFCCFHKLHVYFNKKFKREYCVLFIIVKPDDVERFGWKIRDGTLLVLPQIPQDAREAEDVPGNRKNCRDFPVLQTNRALVLVVPGFPVGHWWWYSRQSCHAVIALLGPPRLQKLQEKRHNFESARDGVLENVQLPQVREVSLEESRPETGFFGNGVTVRQLDLDQCQDG
jgi:hypothetical protein